MPSLIEVPRSRDYPMFIRVAYIARMGERSRVAWPAAMLGIAATLGIIAFCAASLFAFPAFGGSGDQLARTTCVAAARYVFRTEHRRPRGSFADFERQNPSYCENALVVPDSDGVWPGTLFEQILQGAVWVRVKFGPTWRDATGRPGRIVVVRRSGVDDPT